jgi:hypothetical protein
MTVIRRTPHMRRVLMTITSVVALLTASATAASAGSPASPKASCVATITSYEATQLAPGSVGEEVSELAHIGPGLATPSSALSRVTISARSGRALKPRARTTSGRSRPTVTLVTHPSAGAA